MFTSIATRARTIQRFFHLHSHGDRKAMNMTFVWFPIHSLKVHKSPSPTFERRKEMFQFHPLSWQINLLSLMNSNKKNFTRQSFFEWKSSWKMFFDVFTHLAHKPLANLFRLSSASQCESHKAGSECSDGWKMIKLFRHSFFALLSFQHIFSCMWRVVESLRARE